MVKMVDIYGILFDDIKNAHRLQKDLFLKWIEFKDLIEKKNG